MKNLKNTTNVAGQSNKNIVKSQKHDVNLQKNSTLYFQVGLILCLLATYGLFEMKFETQLAKLAQVAPIDENSEYFADMPLYGLENGPCQMSFTVAISALSSCGCNGSMKGLR